jgi:hypothetical protein
LFFGRYIKETVLVLGIGLSASIDGSPQTGIYCGHEARSGSEGFLRPTITSDAMKGSEQRRERL